MEWSLQLPEKSTYRRTNRFQITSNDVNYVNTFKTGLSLDSDGASGPTCPAPRHRRTCQCRLWLLRRRRGGCSAQAGIEAGTPQG